MTTNKPNLDWLGDNLPANAPTGLIQRFAEIAEKDADSNRLLRERFLRNVTMLATAWLTFVAVSIALCIVVAATDRTLLPIEYIAALNTAPPLGVGGLLYIIAKYLFPER